MDPPIESVARLGCFLAVLVVMTVWEILAPCRLLSVRKSPRWASNLGLVAVNTVIVRVAIPITAVGLATIAEKGRWGLLHQAGMPLWVKIAFAVVALDLLIYLQHVMFHAVPALWRLHMVHHADLDFDVTTGLRFHTGEILLSSLVKLAGVVILGAPAVAVLLFEITLNATSMFNHGNVRLPIALDRILRCFLVTPDMHRVHHSVETRETNSNFGFNLPWWDYLLGTYRAQPVAGHLSMTIGVRGIRDQRQADRLPGMFLLPFVGDPGDVAIHRRDPASPSSD